MHMKGLHRCTHGGQGIDCRHVNQKKLFKLGDGIDKKFPIPNDTR